MPLRFIMWNVQHGSAALIQTPNGKSIAVDLGAGEYFSPLKAIRDAGIYRLDHVTVTHPHMDHIDDILHFDELAPGTFLSPKHLTEDEIRGNNPPLNQEAEDKIQKYLEIRRRYSSPVGPHEDVDLPQNNGGVSIKTFVPSQSSTSNLNNHSVVTAIEYSGVKILVPGDNESPSWTELLGRSDFVSAVGGTHVLVAAHHGRASGFHQPLFEHFSPLITLVSDGRTVDTSVTSRYTGVSRGWDVDKRSGGRERRYCVTTRNDGMIVVEVNPRPNQVGTLGVTID